jgi:hypothetical protein
MFPLNIVKIKLNNFIINDFFLRFYCDFLRFLELFSVNASSVFLQHPSPSVLRLRYPFGGFKQSGVGREFGPFGLEHSWSQEL